MEGTVYMLNVILQYWPIILALIIVATGLLKLHWRVQNIEKSSVQCEARCKDRVDTLKTEYNNDLKEMKSDLKENMRLAQNMNVSLASLTAYLQGKGVTPPVG